MRLARSGADPDGVEAGLAAVQAQAVRILDDLRTLTRGIHPPVLSDRGLVAAIEARAATLPIGVTIECAEGVRETRWPPTLEAAAYFVVSEALTNVLKHSRSAGALVRVGGTGDALQVEIEDGGVGFVPADAGGTGLTGMRDRVETLGGDLRLVSNPGSGTRVRVRLPVPAVRGRA